MRNATFLRAVRLKPLLFSASLFLGACQTVPQNTGSNARVEDVVSRIKEDLVQYEANTASLLARSANERAAVKDADPRCADLGGFVITQVDVVLTVATTATTTVSGDLVLPVGSVGTFGPSFSNSNVEAGTQTMSFSLYPFPKAANRARALVGNDKGNYPITANLQALTEGLTNVNQSQPCLSLFPLDGHGQPASTDNGGTFAYGFTVTNTDGTAAGLKFVLFSLGASRENERKVGNTITVTFKAVTRSAAAEYVRLGR